MKTQIKVGISNHGKKIAKVNNVFVKAQKKAQDINDKIMVELTEVSDTIKELEIQKETMELQFNRNKIMITNVNMLLGDKELVTKGDISKDKEDSLVEMVE